MIMGITTAAAAAAATTTRVIRSKYVLCSVVLCSVVSVVSVLCDAV